MTLLIGLIFLLIISVLNVAMIKSTSINTQIAGNSIFKMLAFQGAESSLAKATRLKHIDKLNTANIAYKLSELELPEEKLSGGGMVISNATLNYNGTDTCPMLIGMSTKLTCAFTSINVESNVASTNARANHIKGIVLLN